MTDAGFEAASASGLPVTVLAGPPLDLSAVTRLVAVDSVEQVRDCDPGTLVLIPGYCCRQLTSYELDIVVRHASDRALPGLVLVGSARVPVTVRTLAERTGISLMGTDPDQPIVALIRQLDRLLDQGAGAAMERALATVEMLRTADATLDHRQVLRRAGQTLGSALELGWFAPEPQDGAAIIVGGCAVAWLRTSDAEDPAIRICLPALAAALGQRYEQAALVDEVRGEALAAVLDISVQDGDRHLRAANALGVDVHADHHVAVLISEGRTSAAAMPYPAAARPERMLVTVAVRELLEPQTPSWTVAPVEHDLALVWTHPPLGASSDALFNAAVSEIVAIVERQYSELAVYAGVSPGASGLEGMRTGVVEARAAARWARARAVRGRPVQLDGSRVHQLLGDIVASPMSRRTLRDILEPVNTLPESQRRTSVLTLCTYLEAQGSNRRAATVLHLHPNAVAYRITKLTKLLAVDLGDPDARLVLHLACRLWLLDTDKGLQRADGSTKAGSIQELQSAERIPSA